MCTHVRECCEKWAAAASALLVLIDGKKVVTFNAHLIGAVSRRREVAPAMQILWEPCSTRSVGFLDWIDCQFFFRSRSSSVSAHRLVIDVIQLSVRIELLKKRLQQQQQQPSPCTLASSMANQSHSFLSFCGLRALQDGSQRICLPHSQWLPLSSSPPPHYSSVLHTPAHWQFSSMALDSGRIEI